MPAPRLLLNPITSNFMRIKFITQTANSIIMLGMLAALSVFTANTSRAQYANAIGAKFAFGTGYEGGALSPGPFDPAGVFLQTNWNSLVTVTANNWANFPNGFIFSNLADSLHANSGAALQITGVANGWESGTPASPPSPNYKLLRDCLELNRNGQTFWTGTNTYTFTNLPVPGSGTYDVYVYINSQDSGQELALQCNGTTYYQGTLQNSDPVTFSQGNNTTSGTWPTCNYVLFSGVAPSSGTITVLALEQPTVANTGGDAGVAGIQLIPTGTVQQNNFLAFSQQPAGQNVNNGSTATFNALAVGTGSITYQWYEITANGSATNTLASTTTSYTTPTLSLSDNGESYFVVANNGSSSMTSSIVQLTVNQITAWAVDAGGSWGNSANWLNSIIASGSGTVALFTNAITANRTVTLDANYTIGTAQFGTNGATSTQPGWTINPGSPPGTLTLEIPDPVSVTPGGGSDTVVNAGVITVAGNQTVTINAPLAGTNGLYVSGGGTLVLAGGNTNSTFSGPTILGVGNSDITTLQIGNGGASGSLDLNPANNIYIAGAAHLIFNRSDTIAVSNVFNGQPAKEANVIVNSGTVILAPQANQSPWLGAVVNSGGTLVLNCPSNGVVGSVNAINNNSGSVNITNGTPRTVAQGNSGNTSLAINSGGTVQLTGQGGYGVNIATGVGVLNNGIFDLGGDVVQIRSIAGAGIVTNSGATLAILRLNSAPIATFPWGGNIVDGASAQTKVWVSGSNQAFTNANSYTGDTLISGGSLTLSNSATVGSANVYIAGGNLTNWAASAFPNANATIYVGSGRRLEAGPNVPYSLNSGLALGSGQTLVVTNTGIVESNLTAAAGSTVIVGGTGVAGTMTENGTLTLNGDANNFDLATATTEGGGVNDEIVVNGNLTLSGNITFNINPLASVINGSVYKLIKYSGTLNNTATFTVVPSTISGLTLSVDTTVNPGYVSLDVTGPPSAPVITASSATNVAAFVGFPTTLSVTASGVPTPQYQWYGGPNGSGTLISGATASSYTFTPAVPAATNYYCHVYNNQGSTNGNFAVTVYGSLPISAQFALATSYQGGSLYLAPTDSAGVVAMSNWNVLGPITPSTATAAGLTYNNLVASNGVPTPAALTVLNVQDGWIQSGNAITASSPANARFMNTFWKVNPGHTPATNIMYLIFTNLPTDNYDVYLYLMQNYPDGAAQGYIYSQGQTNYVALYGEFNSDTFVTGTNTTGIGTYPTVNYTYLGRLSTGTTNGFTVTTVYTTGADGLGVPGIQIVPSDPTPAFVQQPLSTSISAGTIFTNTVQARGKGTLFYQWYQISGGVTNALSNAGHISGATTNSLVLNPSQGTDNGGYFVVVTNAYGSATSSVATLTVYTVPVITLQSSSDVTVYVGQSPKFFVTAVGPLPLYYQWKTNAVAATGATNSTLTLNNAQPGNNGETFVCVVTNSYGSATTSVATLTVVAAPTDAYAVAVLNNNPMAYFRLDETPDDAAGNNGKIAHDYAGGNNGVYSNTVLNVAGFPYGPPLPANTDPAAQFGTFATHNSYAGSIPLDFAVPTNQNAAFSVETWVYGQGPQPNAGFVSKGYGAGGEQFCLSASAGGNNFTFFVRDVSGAVHQVITGNTPFAVQGWYHLVGVCDEPNGLVHLYVNGLEVGTGAAITPGSGLLSSPLSVAIGARPSIAGTNYDTQLVGTLDEVAIYNYALSSNQVAAHYYSSGIPPTITLQPLATLAPSYTTNALEGQTVTMTGAAVGSPPRR
jgi:autotransporter-associated beta strand protein